VGTIVPGTAHNTNPAQAADCKQGALARQRAAALRTDVAVSHSRRTLAMKNRWLLLVSVRQMLILVSVRQTLILVVQN